MSRHPRAERRTLPGLTGAAGLLAWALLAGAACQPAQQPYEEVAELRVLAIRATPPYLPPGETVQIDALIHGAPGAEAPITYAWSWCPIPSTAAGGFSCAITRDELQALADEAAPGLVTVPPFELGADPAALLTYPLPPAALEAACQAFLSQELPEFVDAPDCTRGFPIQLRLVVSQGDQQVEAVKELRLLYSADDPGNQNPSLAELYWGPPGTAPPSLTPLVADGAPTPLPRGQEVLLRAEIPPETLERYVPDPTPQDPAPVEIPEQLAVSWFAEGGAFDKARTGTQVDRFVYSDAEQNTWTPPYADDQPRERVVIYAVIRDVRGGVGWLRREVALVP